MLPLNEGSTIPLMVTRMAFAVPVGILPFTITEFPVPLPEPISVADPCTEEVQLTAFISAGTASIIKALMASLSPLFVIFKV
ncbi:hypothetical protein D3C72_2471440 [compost metagenome]